MSDLTLALDIGGTKIAAGLVDADVQRARGDAVFLGAFGQSDLADEGPAHEAAQRTGGIKLGVVGAPRFDDETRPRGRRLLGGLLVMTRHQGHGDAQTGQQRERAAASEDEGSAILQKVHGPWLRRVDDAFKLGGPEYGA